MQPLFIGALNGRWLMSLDHLPIRTCT